MISLAKQLGLTTAVLGLASLTAGRAHADIAVVSGFDSSYTTNGSWFISAQQTGGAASIVSATPTPPPFSPGAALLTTTNDNNSKIEVSVKDSFGAASQLGTSFGASYTFYKDTSGGPDPNAAAAPALKLTISDGTNGITFVYEPYYQGPNPTPNQWNTQTINATSEFWATDKHGTGFGLSTVPGGGSYATNKTLAGWIASITGASNIAAFNNATLTTVGIGMGTYNQGQVGYVDSLTVSGTSLGSGSRTYDFQPAAVPEPSTLAIAGLGVLGFLGYGLKRRAQGR
jgi:hypothetical protein